MSYTTALFVRSIDFHSFSAQQGRSLPPGPVRAMSTEFVPSGEDLQAVLALFNARTNAEHQRVAVDLPKWQERGDFPLILLFIVTQYPHATVSDRQLSVACLKNLVARHRGSQELRTAVLQSVLQAANRTLGDESSAVRNYSSMLLAQIAAEDAEANEMKNWIEMNVFEGLCGMCFSDDTPANLRNGALSALSRICEDCAEVCSVLGVLFGGWLRKCCAVLRVVVCVHASICILCMCVCGCVAYVYVYTCVCG